MKYQLIKQHSEEDCGAACLALIAKHYQRIFTISRIREAVGTRREGTTLLGLSQGASALGFNTRAIKAELKVVDKDIVPLPAIIHWKGYHWVILYGKKGHKYVVADPGVGVRFLDKKTLMEGWTNGVMLLLEADPVRFAEQSDDRDQVRNFSYFFQRVAAYKGILSQTLLINCVLGLLSLASPFLLQILTDDVLVRGDLDLLTRVAIAVIVMHLVRSCLQLAQSNLIAHFAQRIKLGLVFEFGRQILRLPLTYYETRRSGEIVSRLEDIQEINQLIAQAVVSLPSQFFVALISLGIMFFYSVKLTLVGLAIALVMMLSTIVFMPTLQQKVRQTMALSAENQGIVEIARKRISQFQASGKVTIATLNREQEALKQQTIEIQKQLERHQKQLHQASIDRDRTIIKAPTSGILFQLNLHNSGQNVQAGTEIARIASENTSLWAKAYVNPQDISQVTAGQPAQVRISACPYPDYGVLQGTVTQISPDAISVRSGEHSR